MEYLKLFEAEYRVMQIIWDNEPITSRKLSELCFQELGWKRTTTYTMLKRLNQKGYTKNEDAIVSSLISREEVQKQESKAFIDKNFAGSLSSFIAAFTRRKNLSQKEINEIKDMIESYGKGKKK